MSYADLFFKTLKRIGYNEADLLDESDFTSDLSQEELRSFVEVFCTLDENNVLTTEEIEEYSALTSADHEEIEVFLKSGQAKNDDDEQEKRKDIYFLQEHLTNLENDNKTLQRQIELFKKHEENLLQEKATQENFLVSAKKRFKTIEISKVPKAEDEFISTLKSCLENAGDIKSLISFTDDGENKLPSSDFFKDLIHQYLETEKKILHCISTNIQTNFQLEENGNFSFIENIILQNEKLKNEVIFLQKKLKNNIVENVTSTMEIKKNESMVKYFEITALSQITCPIYQLRQKVDDALKYNEHLRSKEESKKSYLSDVASKYVDALVAEVSLCVAVETFNHFQSCIERISLPKNYLVRQRLRVEMLIASLCEQKNKFVNLHELIQDVCKKINDEKLDLQERQDKIERNQSEASNQKAEQDLETSVFSSMYRILANFNDVNIPDKSIISVMDVVAEAHKILVTEDSLNKEQEDNLKIINQLENHTRSLESLLYAEEKYSNWPQLEQLWNVSLNNLSIKLGSLENSISECNKDMDQKQKLLEKRRNLQLSRNLFVYALMNRELFKRHIDDIKIAIENSNGYISKSYS